MVPWIDTTQPGVQSDPAMSDASSSEQPRAPRAPSQEGPQTGRLAYEAPRIERRVPVARHTLQGPQTSGSESFFPP